MLWIETQTPEIEITLRVFANGRSKRVTTAILTQAIEDVLRRVSGGAKSGYLNVTTTDSEGGIACGPTLAVVTFQAPGTKTGPTPQHIDPVYYWPGKKSLFPEPKLRKRNGPYFYQ